MQYRKWAYEDILAVAALEKECFSDPWTFRMLAAGKTEGVFQLESSGITSVCTRLGPKSVEDITAVIALYRPGPMESIPRFIYSISIQSHIAPSFFSLLHKSFFLSIILYI